MTTTLLFVFALEIIFVPFSQSGSSPPCVSCVYGGKVWSPKFKFSLEKVPERCDVIIYGRYLFDDKPNEDDKNAITSLVQEGKTVYTFVSFKRDSLWGNVFGETDNKLVGPLEDYIKSLKIQGVILDYLGIYNGKMPALDCQINAFVTKLKADIPSLIVGIVIDGYLDKSYTNTTAFDYTITNDQIDFYLVDASTAGDTCNADSLKTGLLPITTNKPKVASLEEVCIMTKSSAMDQNKVIIGFNLGTIKMDGVSTYGTPLPYPEYCAGPHDSNVVWCADTPEMCYNLAKYSKQFFKGLVIEYVSSDDFDDSCGCGPGPISNAFIDGWKSLELKCCAKISGA